MSTAKGEPVRRRVLMVFGGGRKGGLCRELVNRLRHVLHDCRADVRAHDLFGDGFDPVLRLGEEAPHARPCTDLSDALAAVYQEDVQWADRYIVVHPVWWFAPPAILKGWVDRVLVDTIALRQVPGESPKPLLEGRRALVVQTFNSSRAIDRDTFGGISGDFWKRVVFPSVGVTRVGRLPLYSVESLEPERLDRFGERLGRAVRALLE